MIKMFDILEIVFTCRDCIDGLLSWNNIRHVHSVVAEGFIETHESVHTTKIINRDASFVIKVHGRIGTHGGICPSQTICRNI